MCVVGSGGWSQSRLEQNAEAVGFCHIGAISAATKI